MTSIEIGGMVVGPGERGRVELPAARLATGSPLGIPVDVVNWLRPVPRVWLIAAIHGDEPNGVEIIRQVLGEVSPRHLAGSLLAVPIVNVHGFITESRYLPDRRDLNRSFPGSARGSQAARLAHLLISQVIGGGDVGIDLHTGSGDRSNFPQLRADLDDPETRRLAQAFGAPLMIHSSTRDGSLRAAATGMGARVLVYEGGEARRFNRHAIEVGTQGVLRVLRALGMRGGGQGPASVSRESRSTRWVRAGRSGLVRLDVEPGSDVEKGQAIGVIKDAFGDRTLRVRASASGVIIGQTRQPNVNRGDALVHIAEFGAPSGEPSGAPEESDRAAPTG
ncbi:succinylglutamate desuccinylase/aspartoacylase family protein [soil metagenome]